MSTPEPSARQILKKAAPFLIALVVLGGGIAIVELTERSKFDVRGAVTLPAGRCDSEGFSDIREGAQVRVVNRANEVLAVGQLERPAFCQSRFTVKDVPAGEDIYGVTAGNDVRGVLWSSEAELRDGVVLSLE